jgi:uncharacterized protein (DUF58 family)
MNRAPASTKLTILIVAAIALAQLGSWPLAVVLVACVAGLTVSGVHWSGSAYRAAKYQTTIHAQEAAELRAHNWAINDRRASLENTGGLDNSTPSPSSGPTETGAA